MWITVNGERVDIDPDTNGELSYLDIVWIARERDGASVTYVGPRHGDSQRSGTLRAGQSVKIEDGMHFTCVMTNNA